MPNIGTAELGLIIAGIAALMSFGVLGLTLVLLWKKLFAPPPAGSEFVTSAELDRVEARLKTDIVNLDTYCRDQFHEFRDKLQQLDNKLAVLPHEIIEAFRKEIEAIKESFRRETEPIRRRLERGAVTMTRICERLKIESPETEEGL